MVMQDGIAKCHGDNAKDHGGVNELEVCHTNRPYSPARPFSLLRLQKPQPAVFALV